jgi:hypothetical protein
VLVQDRLPRPAPGPVELDHEPALVLQLHLVHAILERAQRLAAARAAQAPDFHRVEHAIRRETEERRAWLAQMTDFPASTMSVLPVMNDDSGHERNRIG